MNVNKPLGTLLSFSLLIPTMGFAIEFEDVSSQAGMLSPVESWGSSWGDFDGDYYPDLWTSNHRTQPTLYRNNADGTFTNILPQVWSANPSTDGHGSAWADFDRDGDMDLLEQTGGANPNNPNALNQFYINNNGVLEEQADTYGLVYGAHRGRSVLWFDYDNDGELDLSLTGYTNATGQFPSSIFKNQLPGFTDVSGTVGFDCPIKSNFSTLADLSGDGRLDLICHAFTFPQKIYDITTIPFTDITGLLPKTSLVFDSAFADLNGDLKADNLNIRVPNNRSNTLQVNDFEVHTRLINNSGSSRGFNFMTSGDLEIDLTSPTLKSKTIYIGASGFHPVINSGVARLNITLSSDNADHHGLPPFSQDPAKPGLYIGYNPASQTWILSMSGNNTLWATLRSENAVSDLQVDGYTPSEGVLPRLYLSGPAGYQDKSKQAGFTEKVHCVSLAAGDFDNDGDVDIYKVCEQSPSNLANRLYENLGDVDNDGVPEFARVPNAGGAEGTTIGAGKNVAMADYDIDGFLDLYVTNGHSGGSIPNGPDQMFRNKGNSNSWIQLDLIGQQSNIHGIGARIIAITPDGRSQLREQAGGTHSYTQNHQRIHFGLGQNSTVDLEITWPNGSVDTYAGVAVNRLYNVTEGLSMEAVDLGNDPTPPATFVECGEPAIDTSSEKALFIWKDCPDSSAQSWQVIAASGGDPQGARYVGTVTSDADFSNVLGNLLEPLDVVDSSTPGEIDFILRMWYAAIDGFKMDLPDMQALCFNVRKQPSDSQILLGENKTAMPADFCAR